MYQDIRLFSIKLSGKFSFAIIREVKNIEFAQGKYNLRQVFLREYTDPVINEQLESF